MLFWGMLVGLGFAPLLFRFGGEQWARPHYQFFPLMLVAAAFVGWQRIHELRRDRFATGNAWTVHAMLALALLMLLAAAVLWSGRLAASTSLIVMAAAAYRLGGWRLIRELLPSGLLLALVIGPPLGVTDDILQAMRQFAVWTSSRVLLWLEIVHTESGTVLEIPGARLLVAEACSGINSMMAVLGFTLVLAFLRRRGLSHTLLLVASCVIVVFWANTIRIAGGVWLKANYEIDVLTGGGHQLASLVLFSVCMILVFSFDTLISLARLDFASVQQWRPSAGTPADAQIAPDAFPAARLTRPMWLFAAAFAVLGLGQVANAWVNGGVRAWFSGAGTSSIAGDLYLNLPDELAGWRRSPEAEKSVMQPELEAKYSQQWVYRRGDMTVIVAMDYPFPGYHDLAVCYRNGGWQIDSLIPDGEPGGGPYSKASLSRLNERGYFWFSLVNEQGRWVQRPRSDALGRVLERLAHTGPPDWSAPTYQVQLWTQRYEALTDQQRHEALGLFLAARRELASQLMRRLEGEP